METKSKAYPTTESKMEMATPTVIIDNNQILSLAFNLTPTKETLIYGLYKSIFITNSNKINITCGVHQVGENDVPHLSAQVQVSEKWAHSIHLYGFFTPYGFKITRMTAMDKHHNPETIAEF